MKKPDLVAKQREIKQWLDGEVRAYLRHLLDRAGERLGRTVEYHESGVDWWFSVAGERNPELTDGISLALSVCCERFPELLEFSVLCEDLADDFDYRVGDI